MSHAGLRPVPRHKYDPYTITDHYALAAFFSDLADRGFTGNSLPTKRPPEIIIHRPENLAEMKSLQERMNALLAPEAQKNFQDLQDRRNRLTASLRKAKEKDKADLQKRLDTIGWERAKLAGEKDLAEFAKLRKLRAEIENGPTHQISQWSSPEPCGFFPGGNWMDESGPEVLPAVPGFLGDRIGQGPPDLSRSGRLADRSGKGKGKLHARVLANRLWYLFFGRGLAPDLTDFGGQGTPPEHPELLDNLVWSMLDGKWTSRLS